MTEKLGFPKGLLVVEKQLSQLPHLQGKDIPIPDRRVDILCYRMSGGEAYSLSPLLVIECKAVPISHHTLRQVGGYNYYLGAPFIAVANQESLLMGWADTEAKAYRFVDFLPHYSDLIERCGKR